jgi:hypothetical protein
MAEQGQAYPLAFAQAKDEPLVFYGPPDEVRGAIRLHNPSADKVKVYSLALDAADLRAPDGKPLREVRVSARLRADEQALVPVRVEVDPTTPPGTYQATVQIGEEQRAAAVHIVERIDLRIQPAEIWLTTEGELVFEREFVVENAGNVPLRIGPKCLAPLVDSMQVPVSLRRGLEAACKKEAAEVLKDVLCAWSEQQVGNVSLTREDVTLKPGETRTGKGTFTLPDDLQSFRRYDAQLALYNASLHLSVYTGDLRGGPRAPREKE